MLERRNKDNMYEKGRQRTLEILKIMDQEWCEWKGVIAYISNKVKERCDRE